MGAGYRKRLRRVRIRRRHTLAVAAEIKHRVGQNPIAVQQIAHALGHNAQILTNHHAAVAAALQRQNRHQHRLRIMHISAPSRTLIAHHPPKPAHRHHMVDAQHAIKAHVFAQHADKFPITGVLQRRRMQRRQLPVLPHRAEGIGRCTHRHIAAIHTPVQPNIRAAARHAHR